MQSFKKNSPLGLLILIVATTLVAACGGGDSGSPSPSTPPPENNEPAGVFSEVSVQEGTAPKQILFSWKFDGNPAGFRLEVNPDGVSGYQAVDINGDNIVDEADQLAADAEQLALEIPLHLTDQVQARYQLVAIDTAGNELERSSELSLIQLNFDALVGYFKASNTSSLDQFGSAVALSADGKTLAVGAVNESSNVQGITAGSTDEADDAASDSGAVYVFSNEDGIWSQQAYIKSSNADAGDHFGYSLALSADGDTLVVGAPYEDSDAKGISVDDSAGSNNSAEVSGAAYVFTRSGAQWSEVAYIKASNAEAEDRFGHAIALSANGKILAIGALEESSSATGISYDHSGELDNSSSGSGAVYLFVQAEARWVQQAYIKASNTEEVDLFGSSLALSADGNTLAVSAVGEDSSATGVSTDGSGEDDNSAFAAGAVYIFNREGTLWSQTAYVKPSQPISPHDGSDGFGDALALSADGKTLAVGASAHSNGSCEFNGYTENSYDGAIFVFSRTDERWAQQALITEDYSDCFHHLGAAIALSEDGDTLVAGSTGKNNYAGAALVYRRFDSVWVKGNQVTAPNPDIYDDFGGALALSADGKILAIGAEREDGSAKGVGGDTQDNQALISGAVYVY